MPMRQRIVFFHYYFYNYSVKSFIYFTVVNLHLWLVYSKMILLPNSYSRIYH